MPWKETRVSDERLRFLIDYRAGEATMSELCEAYGISRKTGYKLLARFASDGLAGLSDCSRAPHQQARATSPILIEQLVAFKHAHPHWGPRKIKHRLSALSPGTVWPSASTIGAILKRHGLVADRHYRRRTPPYTQPFGDCEAPNDNWCCDLKGWFLTQDGQRCDPFTLSDAYSRFLLRCQVVPRANYHWIKPIMDAAFREYGLPRAIRSDNGPPFAAAGLGGLSRLAVEWIRLGIRPERIAAGHPEQNSRHERMHRTLKEGAIQPPAANACRQQEAFDRFRTEYNHERPHESLGQKPPASAYGPSPRPYPRRTPPMEYPGDYHVRVVGACGTIRWKVTRIFVGNALIGEPIGLIQADEDRWRIYFGPVLLAVWNQRRQRREKPSTVNTNDHK